MEIWIRKTLDEEGTEGWTWQMMVDDNVLGKSARSFSSEHEAMESARDVIMEVRRVGDVTFIMFVKEYGGHAVL